MDITFTNKTLNTDYVTKIMKLLSHNEISIFQDTDDLSVKCHIGDYHFYFTRLEENDVLEDFSTYEIADMIADVLLNPEQSGIDKEEQQYYLAVINLMYDSLNLKEQDNLYEEIENNDNLNLMEEEMTFEEELDLDFVTN